MQNDERFMFCWGPGLNIRHVMNVMFKDVINTSFLTSSLGSGDTSTRDCLDAWLHVSSRH